MSDEELKKLIAANAKAIEALSNALTLDRQERRQERSQLYQYLGRIASAQSNFYEVQADYYHQLAALQERQTRIEEQQAQMQTQIVEILRRMASQDG